MKSFNALAKQIHQDNIKAGWWNNLRTGEFNPDRNVPEMLMLIVSELSEADEGWTFQINDDKVKHLPMWVVELADTSIRIFDLLGRYETGIEALIDEDNYFIIQSADIQPSEFSRLIMMLVNHVSRAMEGYRKGLTDPDMPPHSQLEANLCRLLRDCYKIADELGSYDLDEVIAEKRAYNAHREDHKLENRLKAGGKAF